MQIVKTVAELRTWRGALDGTLGLVPTMGALHDGHLALVRRARRDNDQRDNGHVAASVFVNPAQFNREDDLEDYPRDFERDAELLAGEGCDLLFAPGVGEIYPPGFDTWVEPGAVAEPNEGAHRPGHFRGVATVVLKLFGLVQPHRAYFGRKDAQQLAVIRALVRDLDVATEIVPVETVREADGLAMSSRNALLDAEERRAATVLFRALSAARDAHGAGEYDAEVLRETLRRVLGGEPRARVDYVSVADPDTFEELERVAGRALLSLAVGIGRVRLIDNVLVGD